MIKAKQDFILQKMMDDYMIIAVGDAGDHFRDILQTNETGAFYWRQLKKGTTVDDMVKSSMERFVHVTEDELRKDIEEFIYNVSDALETT